MQAYIIRRLLLIIPTIFVASLIVFFLIRSIPGDIVTKMAAQHMGIWKDADSAAVKARLGLDVPSPVQYGRWIGVIRDQHGSFSGLLQGSLGLSLWRQKPVTGIVLNRLPVTFELATLSLIIAVLIALPIGIYSAIRQDTIGDYIARSFGILALSIPGFWLGTMVVVFPAIWWGWSPPLELIRFNDDPLGNLEQYIVPSLVLGMIMSGIIMRMTRTMMLEVLRQDSIRTAWSKGLKERVIILRHALPNAMIPVITVIGFLIPWVIGGTVITEKIFGLPGLGHLLLMAIHDRDYAIVSGVTMFIAVFVMLSNLVIDLSYSFLDPRIRV
jgi:peptide/nickel transport system permease protein